MAVERYVMNLMKVSAAAFVIVAVACSQNTQSKPEGDKVKKENRLAKAKSPYLQQHKTNPVEWFEWGDEAFKKAKDENKPIFLSIGYSTCHWCHVMAHESFEDTEVAKFLNENFVSIKVDREERPDVDEVYMKFVISISGHGGWPMTVFMTPEKLPFFGGTYFPKARFLELLKAVDREWKQNRDDVLAQAKKIKEAIDEAETTSSVPSPMDNVAAALDTQLMESFDAVEGGFGGAPKFPRPMIIDYIFQRNFYKKNDQMLEAALLTLDKMSDGGIYDHLGGGFARYSTDKEWLVPHFEKMLYDNALLARTYLDAYVITKKPRYLNVAESVLVYLQRDMMHKDGGFYAAEDADSEGVEGKFYTWTKDEIDRILGKDAELFDYYYGVTKEGNFQDPHSTEGRKVILSVKGEVDAARKKFGKNVEETLEKCRKKLFEARSKRTRPHRDDKIIVAWNAWAISAFVRAYEVSGNEKYLSQAVKTVDFIRKNLVKNGRLLRYFMGEPANVKAYVDDYAAFADALFDVFEATGDPGYYNDGKKFVDDAIELFWDESASAFAMYGKDSEQLFSKSFEIYDGAIPSANSLAARVLFRLHSLTGDDKYSKLLDRLIKKFSPTIVRYPAGYPVLVGIFDLMRRPHVSVTVFEDAPAELRQAALSCYYPNKTVGIVTKGNKEALSKIPLFSAVNSSKGSGVLICKGTECLPPVRDAAEFQKLLSEH